MFGLLDGLDLPQFFMAHMLQCVLIMLAMEYFMDDFIITVMCGKYLKA